MRGACVRCINGLRKIDPVFGSWYPYGKEQYANDPNSVPIRLTRKGLEAEIAKGVIRDDFRKIMEPASFHVWWWNGGAGGAFTELRIGCGDSGFPQCVNHCSLDPPLLGKPFRKVVRAETMRTICEIIVRAWQPDYGFVSSYQFREQNSLLRRPGPEPGWIVYLADDRVGQLPRLPKFAKVTKIPRHGHLISATESRFTASNPKHVQAAMQIGEALGFLADMPAGPNSTSKLDSR